MVVQIRNSVEKSKAFSLHAFAENTGGLTTLAVMKEAAIAPLGAGGTQCIFGPSQQAHGVISGHRLGPAGTHGQIEVFSAQRHRAVGNGFSHALGDTQRRGMHVMVDIPTRWFPKGAVRILEAVKFILTSAFFGLIGWKTFGYGLTLRASGEVSETLKLPYYPFIFCVALGFLVLALALLFDLILLFRKPEPQGPPEKEPER